MLLFFAWLLFAIACLAIIGVCAVIRFVILWIEHGLTLLCGAALTVLFRLRPVPPQGTKPPSDPTATAPVTDGLA
jgi:hypothetical protein